MKEIILLITLSFTVNLNAEEYPHAEPIGSARQDAQVAPGVFSAAATIEAFNFYERGVAELMIRETYETAKQKAISICLNSEFSGEQCAEGAKYSAHYTIHSYESKHRCSGTLTEFVFGRGCSNYQIKNTTTTVTFKINTPK